MAEVRAFSFNSDQADGSQDVGSSEVGNFLLLLFVFSGKSLSSLAQTSHKITGFDGSAAESFEPFSDSYILDAFKFLLVGL